MSPGEKHQSQLRTTRLGFQCGYSISTLKPLSGLSRVAFQALAASLLLLAGASFKIKTYINKINGNIKDCLEKTQSLFVPLKSSNLNHLLSIK